MIKLIQVVGQDLLATEHSGFVAGKVSGNEEEAAGFLRKAAELEATLMTLIKIPKQVIL